MTELNNIQTLQNILGPRCPKCGRIYLEIVNAKYTFFFIHQYPEKNTTHVDGHEIHEKMAAIKCAVNKGDLVDLELPHWYHIMQMPNRAKILKPLLQKADLPITPPPTPEEFMEMVTKKTLDDIHGANSQPITTWKSKSNMPPRTEDSLKDDLVGAMAHISELEVLVDELKATNKQLKKEMGEMRIAKDSLLDHKQKALQSLDELLVKVFWAAHKDDSNSIPQKMLDEIQYNLKLDIEP